ncbi:MAG: c-type cytochrome [Chitinophagaceae bacterium]
MKIALTLFFSILSTAVFCQAKPKPKSGGVPTSITKLSLSRGKIVYETYCLPCHQQDGAGVARLNPPLVKNDWVNGDKKRLINVILKGLDQPMEINGETYNNVMASHDYLTDLEVADVLTYVRNSFGNKASPITPVEVKAVRGSKK